MNKRYIKPISLMIMLALFAFSCSKEEASKVENSAPAVSESVVTNNISPIGNMSSLTGPMLGLGSTSSENIADYKVTFIDQMNNPVEAVMLQVCDEKTCYVYTSDANGVCSFELPAGDYELHTLIVPNGYSGNTDEVLYATSSGCDLTIVLKKN